MIWVLFFFGISPDGNVQRPMTFQGGNIESEAVCYEIGYDAVARSEEKLGPGWSFGFICHAIDQPA